MERISVYNLTLCVFRCGCCCDMEMLNEQKNDIIPGWNYFIDLLQQRDFHKADDSSRLQTYRHLIICYY